MTTTVAPRHTLAHACAGTQPIRHVTLNLRDWTAAATSGLRLTQLRDVLAELKPDVVSVQEIMADTARERSQVFAELAAALGMGCHVPDLGGLDQLAFEPGRRTRGLGLLWNPARVAPVPGSLRRYNLDPFYNGMVLAKLDIQGCDGQTIRIAAASTHLTPRGQYQRRDEAWYVGSEVAAAAKLAVAGLDANSPMGSRVRGRNRFYDKDPYYALLWGSADEMIGRCHREQRPPWWRHALGLPVRHWADRTAMTILEAAGLVDPAPWIRAPWYRTTGHWNHKSVVKRSDGPFVTPAVADAVIAVESLDTDLTRRLSDHLPVLLVMCPDVMRYGIAARPGPHHPAWVAGIHPIRRFVLRRRVRT